MSTAPEPKLSPQSVALCSAVRAAGEAGLSLRLGQLLS